MEFLHALGFSTVPFIQHLRFPAGLAQEGAASCASLLVFFEAVNDDIRPANFATRAAAPVAHVGVSDDDEVYVAPSWASPRARERKG